MSKSKYAKAKELEAKVKEYCSLLTINTQVDKDGKEYYDCWIRHNGQVEYIRERNWHKFKAIVLEKVFDLCIKEGK